MIMALAVAVKENGNDLNGEGLAFSCSVKIDFIPYHLTHCVVNNDVYPLQICFPFVYSCIVLFFIK